MIWSNSLRTYVTQSVKMNILWKKWKHQSSESAISEEHKNTSPFFLQYLLKLFKCFKIIAKIKIYVYLSFDAYDYA